MPTLQVADARTPISIADAPELARMLQNGSGGEIMLRGALEDMLGSGTLFLDGLRRRPRYFDGRFLTGADLTRDQDYIRQRQADIARAGGTGVISGLEIDDFGSTTGDMLRIEAGHGITPSGDLVMLATRRGVPLLDLPVARQLDAAMGIAVDPRVPLGKRTGLYLIALRSVEFTANPIAAYPRSITGQRTVEDGDIIEATAITLIPFPDRSGAATLTDARRAVARQIFLGAASGGMPQDALPLAMIALDRGSVRWIDTAMVRRELGADSGIQFSLGGRPRALAEAHVLQHRAHLQDVLAAIDAQGSAPIFSASQFFSALPAAGQLPAGAVQPDDGGFQQIYFPPAVDVDLAFVPSDEIAALVEESLSLPPVDLDGAADELDATGIVILVPVTRERYQRFANTLPATTIRTTSDPAQGLKRPAIDMLDALVLRRRKLIEAQQRDAAGELAAETAALETQAWHSTFAEAIANLPAVEGRPPLLWYIRRRSIPYRANVEGLAIAVSSDDIVVSAIVNENLARLKLEKRLAAVNGQATPQASARIAALLGAPRIASSDIMTVAVIADLEKVATPPEAPTESVRTPVATPIVSPILSRSATAAQPRAIASVAEARAGLSRINLATALGSSTAVRADTPLGLSESEVLDIASDYSDPKLGEGIAAIESVLGVDWPPLKQVLFIGNSGLALALDTAFRKAPAEALPDLAQKLAEAVKGSDTDTMQSLIKGLS
jgi:hypothetical protein